MALFKTTRDQLKANTLVSHLEFAQRLFQPHNTIRCEHHLKAAQKSLGVVLQAQAEYILSDAGWQYVAQLAATVHSRLVQSGHTELASIANEIGHRACVILGDREDPVSEAELESYVEPEEPEDRSPRVRRDPFELFDTMPCPQCGFRGRRPPDPGRWHVTCARCKHQWDTVIPDGPPQAM